MGGSSAEIPVIDVGGLRQVNPSDALQRIAGQMRTACRSTGFFYVAGHGIPDEVIEGIFEVNRRFHALPLDEKIKLKRNAWHRGYVPVGGNVARSSARFASTARPNLVESLNIRHEVSPEDPDYKVKPLQGPNEWPADPWMKETIRTYVAAVRDLGLALLDPMSVAAGSPPGYFRQFFSPPSTNLRMLHYPPGPAVRDEDLFGVHPHTDYGFLTILSQDSVGGLQVQRVDGTWIAAPYIRGTFVLNVGDMLARWTNDEFNSTPHRVIPPAASIDRYSVAFFFDPSLEAHISCLAQFTGPGRPAKYEPVRYGDYYSMRLDANFQRAGVGETSTPAPA